MRSGLYFGLSLLLLRLELDLHLETALPARFRLAIHGLFTNQSVQSFDHSFSQLVDVGWHYAIFGKTAISLSFAKNRFFTAYVRGILVWHIAHVKRMTFRVRLLLLPVLVRNHLDYALVFAASDDQPSCFLHALEKLLSMRSHLRTSPRAHIVFNLVPFFAILKETLEEELVFMLPPFAVVS